MVFVVLLDKWVGEEIIIRWNRLALTSCPIHILLFASKIVIIVHKAQYQFNPILSCLRYHKIQPLFTKTNQISEQNNNNNNKQPKTNKQRLIINYLKHLLIIRARWVLQRPKPTITESPSSCHGKAMAFGFWKSWWDFVSVWGLRGNVH